jgi:hypothetical protein
MDNEKEIMMSLINDGIALNAFNTNLFELMRFAGISRSDLLLHNDKTKDHDCDILIGSFYLLGVNPDDVSNLKCRTNDKGEFYWS